MLRRIGVGADEREDPVGAVGVGRIDLLAVDEPLVAVADRARLQRGEVGAGARLGVALRPSDLAPEGGGQEARLLLLGAVRDQRRAEHRDALPADVGRAGGGHLLLEDELLDGGHAGAAVFGRPVRRHPAALVHGLLPLHGGGLRLGLAEEAVVLPAALVAELAALVGDRLVVLGQPLLDEVVHLLSEARLVGGIGPVHSYLLARPPGQRNRDRTRAARQRRAPLHRRRTLARALRGCPDSQQRRSVRRARGASAARGEQGSGRWCDWRTGRSACAGPLTGAVGQRASLPGRPDGLDEVLDLPLETRVAGEGGRRLKVAQRRFEVAKPRIRDTAVDVATGVARVEFDRLVVVGDGAFEIPEARVRVPAVVVGGGVTRVEFDRLVVVGDGAFEVPGARVRVPAVVVGGGRSPGRVRSPGRSRRWPVRDSRGCSARSEVVAGEGKAQVEFDRPVEV